MNVPPSLILASSSPRRRQLLSVLGIEFEVIPSQADETYLPGETPREHVLRLSCAKAREIGNRFPDRWIIGADTIVFIDETILGKPRDESQAHAMLQRLSGREHSVMTGFCLFHGAEQKSINEVVESFVTVKVLSEEEMSWYIKTGEPFDKAGGYAIQGIGMFMVERVRGSYTNVIGLPMCEVVNALENVQAIRFPE